jgi:predicted transcriptional regulator of viral defense system
MGTLDEIYEVAQYQEGYIANYQVDVSRQMFSHYEAADRLERIQRGIYRVAHFPTSEQEDYIVAYLWSRERGVLSHETALSIHDLSDVLPGKVHLCYPPEDPLPMGQPEWLELHRADVHEDSRQWFGVVPVTTPRRTLVDLASDGFNPELFRQALDEAKERGLVPQDFERTLLFKMMTERRTQ